MCIANSFRTQDAQRKLTSRAECSGVVSICKAKSEGLLRILAENRNFDISRIAASTGQVNKYIGRFDDDTNPEIGDYRLCFIDWRSPRSSTGAASSLRRNESTRSGTLSGRGPSQPHLKLEI